MKKGYVLLVILMALLLMAGCSNKVTPKSGNAANPSPAAQQTGEEVSSSSGASPGGAAEGQKETAETVPGGSPGAEVIVRSGSNVASKDKAELLNQIDQELNQMIKDINNLEDIPDSDLP